MRLRKHFKIGGTLALLTGLIWLAYKIVLVRNSGSEMSSRVNQHIEKHEKHLDTDWDSFIGAWQVVVRNEFFQSPKGNRDASTFFAPLLDAYHPDRKSQDYEVSIVTESN